MVGHEALEEDDQEETDAEDTEVGDVVHEHSAEIFSCAAPYPVVPYQEPAECESDDDGTFKGNQRSENDICEICIEGISGQEPYDEQVYTTANEAYGNEFCETLQQVIHNY